MTTSTTTRSTTNIPTLALCLLLLLLLLTTLPTKINSQVVVPTSKKTFTFTLNKPRLVSNEAEYGATYIDIQTERLPGQITNPPFALCFYNTTPNAYVLAVRTTRSPARFVWAANRNRPVGEGSTLGLGSDGDLTLTRPDGRVVWRSGTVGKGVVGIELTPDGNLVLRGGSMGRGVVWQSFDRPADTLLVGMSLGVDGGPVVSRRSEADGSDGAYSLVMEEQGLVAYWNYDGKGKRVRYADWLGLTSGNRVTLTVDSSNSSRYDLIFEIESSEGRRNYTIKSFPYDPTLSFLRIAPNGNILVFTYDPNSAQWRQTFSYFPDHHVRECALPSTCGRFGLCEEGRCIACPSPTKAGPVPWSEECAPPSLGRRCGGTRGKVGYYRVAGAEHFSTLLTSGERFASASECGRKCSSEGCECKGFVFDKEDRVCLRVPVLGTLIREGNSTRTSVYVKYSVGY